jgi:uncharacterized membrane protein
MKNLFRFSVRDIAIIGMLSALHALSIMIKIPYGQGAMVHLGTAAVFTFAIVFGGKYAGPAGAIGAAFFDLLMGFSPYTLWSFFIKGIAGYMAGLVAHSADSKGASLPRNLIGCLGASAWTLAGYLLAWTVVIGSFTAAVMNIPSSLMSSGVGMLVGIPLGATLRVTLRKAGLFDASKL